MSKLIEFLKNIEAEGILKELEEDPTTLSITGIEFVSQSSIRGVLRDRNGDDIMIKK